VSVAAGPDAASADELAEPIAARARGPVGSQSISADRSEPAERCCAGSNNQHRWLCSWHAGAVRAADRAAVRSVWSVRATTVPDGSAADVYSGRAEPIVRGVGHAARVSGASADVADPRHLLRPRRAARAVGPRLCAAVRRDDGPELGRVDA